HSWRAVGAGGSLSVHRVAVLRDGARRDAVLCIAHRAGDHSCALRPASLAPTGGVTMQSGQRSGGGDSERTMASGWLQRQPLLLSALLAARNAARRGVTWIVAATAVVLGALLLLCVGVPGVQIDAWLEFGIAYIGFVPIVAALHAASLMA